MVENKTKGIIKNEEWQKVRKERKEKNRQWKQENNAWSRGGSAVDPRVWEGSAVDVWSRGGSTVDARSPMNSQRLHCWCMSTRKLRGWCAIIHEYEEAPLLMRGHPWTRRGFTVDALSLTELAETPLLIHEYEEAPRLMRDHPWVWEGSAVDARSPMNSQRLRCWCVATRRLRCWCAVIHELTEASLLMRGHEEAPLSILEYEEAPLLLRGHEEALLLMRDHPWTSRGSAVVAWSSVNSQRLRCWCAVTHGTRECFTGHPQPSTHIFLC